MAGCFPHRYFLSLALCESRCVFAFRLSSRPSNCFPPVSYAVDFYVPIFCSKIVLFPCPSVFSMSSCILPLLAGRIFFRSFGISFYNILSRNLLIFHLLPVASYLVFQVLLIILLVLLFLFFTKVPVFFLLLLVLLNSNSILKLYNCIRLILFGLSYFRGISIFWGLFSVENR